MFFLCFWLIHVFSFNTFISLHSLAYITSVEKTNVVFILVPLEVRFFSFSVADFKIFPFIFKILQEQDMLTCRFFVCFIYYFIYQLVCLFLVFNLHVFVFPGSEIQCLSLILKMFWPLLFQIFLILPLFLLVPIMHATLFEIAPQGIGYSVLLNYFFFFNLYHNFY